MDVTSQINSYLDLFTKNQKQVSFLKDEKKELKLKLIKDYQKILNNELLFKIDNKNINITFLQGQINILNKETQNLICCLTLHLDPIKKTSSVLFNTSNQKNSLNLENQSFKILSSFFNILNANTLNDINIKINKIYLNFLKKEKNIEEKFQKLKIHYFKNNKSLYETGYNMFTKNYIFTVKSEYEDGVTLVNQPSFFDPPIFTLPDTKSIQLLNIDEGIIKVKSIKNKITTLQNPDFLKNFYDIIIHPHIFKFNISTS